MIACGSCASLIMLSGLPASGKSTKAMRMLREAKSPTIRVNKDLLRAMLHAGLPWEQGREGQTRDAEFAVADKMLSSGVSVIVDDTNLGTRHLSAWSALAEAHGLDLVVDFVDTPIEECIRRDSVRGAERVGRTVIVGMARQYLSRKEDGMDVVFDLDGTLADNSHRIPNPLPENFDWDATAPLAVNDKPIMRMLEQLMEHHRAGRRIIYLTGREESSRPYTEEWLRRHGLYDVSEMLIMRPTGDRRPASDFKAEAMRRYCHPHYVHAVYDDDLSVVDRLREFGFPAIHFDGFRADAAA